MDKLPRQSVAPTPDEVADLMVANGYDRPYRVIGRFSPLLLLADVRLVGLDEARALMDERDRICDDSTPPQPSSR